MCRRGREVGGVSPRLPEKCLRFVVLYVRSAMSEIALGGFGVDGDGAIYAFTVVKMGPEKPRAGVFHVRRGCVYLVGAFAQKTSSRRRCRIALFIFRLVVFYSAAHPYLRFRPAPPPPKLCEG